MFNLFNLFKKTSYTYTFTGLLPDLRPQSEKDKDYLFTEAVAFASPVSWTEKNVWRTFPELDQKGQFSCVAHTMAKLLGINYFLRDKTYLDFSRADIYRRRNNKPQPGMAGNDVFNIAQLGVTLNIFVPSDQDNDAQIDALVVEKYKEEIGSVLKINNYLALIPKDFESVASTIQATGKGVMVWFYFNSSEWSQKFPKIIDQSLSQNTALRHSVTAVDFGLINGKKYVKIEDSAHFGGISERWISEEFFNTRNYYAGYAINFKFEVPDVKPKYIQGDVKSLQDCLKSEGTFPSNIDSTGFMGQITKNAIWAFQVKYGIVSTGILDPITNKKLLQLYP